MADYSDYDILPKPEKVMTAGCPIWIVGQGTVIIDHMVISNGKCFKLTTCLTPVMLIPNLTHRLLSLGSFLKQGMHVYGDAATISLAVKGKYLPLVHAVPHAPGEMIYWMKSKLSNTKQIHSVLPTEDYDLMHQHFGHPSKDVLRHASKNTKGFPEINFPVQDDHICPGCAKGKMPAASHPLSKTRVKS